MTKPNLIGCWDEMYHLVLPSPFGSRLNGRGYQQVLYGIPVLRRDSKLPRRLLNCQSATEATKSKHGDLSMIAILLALPKMIRAKNLDGVRSNKDCVRTSLC